jgi:hypothetical protein
MTRFGMAGALAMTIATTARPCDVRGYDVEHERPRENSCPQVVTCEGYDAVDYDAPRLVKQTRDAMAGSGSGEPESTQASSATREQDEARFLKEVWSNP